MGCIAQKKAIVINNNRHSDDFSLRLDLSKLDDLKSKSISNEKKSESHIRIRTTNLLKKIDLNVNDNYQILNKLGKGAFGSVYKVLHNTSNQFRAMKVIKKETLQMQDGDKTFLREVEILKTTDHPNIIKIYEYYQDEKNFYLITEFVSGGELYDTIASWRTFDEEKAGYIIYQLLCAVNYLHSALQIVHRDIKPENILVEKSTNIDSPNHVNIKLIDFGTGNFFDANKNFSMRVGTPYYIAPEVLNKNYNEKVDIWSCGVLLYILLSGEPPFNGSNIQEILSSVRKGEYDMSGPEWKGISKEAKDLVKKMLQFNPQKRISANEAVNHPFLSKITNKMNIEAEKDISRVLKNIKHFNAREKFQQATLAYIVHFFISSQDLQNLKTVFQALDANKDGRLTYQELKEGFQKVHGKHLSDLEVNHIMEELDQDCNGFIEYQEFLRAALNRKKLISEENLRLAFDKFDINGDEKLSKNEIIEVLGTEDSEFITQLIEMVDKNKDGEISYSEFRDMMRKIVYNTMGETLLFESPRKGEDKVTPTAMIQDSTNENVINLVELDNGSNLKLESPKKEIIDINPHKVSI